MEFAHSTSHLHSPYPPRPPTITGQIILRSALTDRFQHLLDPCYRYSTPYTQPSHIDGTAFIDLSLLPTFHRGHCYTLTFLALFSNSLPPRPSVLSVTLGTSNRITIESICAPPPKNHDIPSFSKTLLRTPPTRVPYSFPITKPRIPKSLIAFSTTG